LRIFLTAATITSEPEKRIERNNRKDIEILLSLFFLYPLFIEKDKERYQKEIQIEKDQGKAQITEKAMRDFPPSSSFSPLYFAAPAALPLFFSPYLFIIERIQRNLRKNSNRERKRNGYILIERQKTRNETTKE
jgi:hypothetical protein